MKTILALTSWFALGSMSMKGVVLMHGLITWQTLVVFVILLGACALTLVAIHMAPMLTALTCEPQTDKVAMGL